MIINQSIFEIRPIVDCGSSDKLKMVLEGSDRIYCVDEDVIISAIDIKEVFVSVDSFQNQTQYFVRVRLNKNGNTIFADYSSNHINQRIGMIVHHRLLSAPMLRGKINNASIVISIHKNLIDAENVKKIIDSAIPK